LVTLTLCLSGSTRSSADPAVETQRVIVRAGERVPFDGVLLRVEALARVITELEARAKAAEAETAAVKREAEARAKAVTATAEAALREERERRAAVEADLLRRAELYERTLANAVNSEPWYKSGYLSLGVGILLGGGICAGSVAAGR